jgi:hypothetical protein
MEFKEIENAVKEWSDIRTSPGTVVNYLKQGCCFKIEKWQYELWKKNPPKNFYVYMGIFKGSLKFILTDRVLDNDSATHKDLIFVQDYLPGLKMTEEGFINKAIDGGITVLDALKKTMRWNVFMNSWVYFKVNTTYGIFEAFKVPFSDLVSQFDNAGCEESLVQFGLGENIEAELILWGLDTDLELQANLGLKTADTSAPVEDLATPCPPFGQ